MEDNPQIFYFVATLLASSVGFVLAFIINRFVNRLDKSIELIQEELSELKQMCAKFGNDIEHIKDKVFPVRYPKK